MCAVCLLKVLFFRDKTTGMNILNSSWNHGTVSASGCSEGEGLRVAPCHADSPVSSFPVSSYDHASGLKKKNLKHSVKLQV